MGFSWESRREAERQSAPARISIPAGYLIYVFIR
jgi:hypothetical protein